MKLFIVTLTGTAFELLVSPSDTIMSIKSKIQRFEGIPVGQQHLIWQDNELSDHRSLGDCCIPRGATLRLVLGMRGGPISTYRPPPVATATIKFTPTVHFASSSKKNINGVDNNCDVSSTPLTQSSLLNKNDGDTGGQKKVTLYFVNTGDKFDFMRVADRRHRESAPFKDHAVTSLLNSEDSVESIFPVNSKPPVSNNLTNVTTQSLPYLQTDESALSCEQLLQLTSSSEPSVLKAVDPHRSLDHQAPSPPTTAIITGYLESNSYLSDTDDCLSSDCGVSANATYLLRPPSPEWDNGDLSSTPPLPTFDVPLYGDDGEDDDSSGDLEDRHIYCRTGDVLFGPPTKHKNSSMSSFSHDDWRGAYGDGETSLMTQAKLEERESLAEKMRLIKAQLSMAKEERIQRSLRHQKTEKKRESKAESNRSKEELKLSYGAESVLPSLGVDMDYGKPYVPNMRSYGSQGLRKTTFRRPYTTTSAVDLPTVTTASSSSPSGLSSTMNTLLLPSKRFLKTYQKSRDVVPNKTVSEINLEAATVIPGFVGVCSDYDSFKGSGRSLRQRRFGTVQPPDISKIGVSNRPTDPLGTAKQTEEKAVKIEAKPDSSLFFPPLMPPPMTKSAGYDCLLRPTVAASLMSGRSPVVRTAASCSSDAFSSKETILPRISNTLLLGHLTGRDEGSSGLVTPRITDDEQGFQPPLIASSAFSKTPNDTSEPPRKSPKLKSTRCATCNRKTGLIDSYICRCERTFCSKHRYAELHACTFDYKADARRYIRETNPVVTAAKLPKI